MPSTYLQILKSTALVGGSSVLSMMIGIVRTKAMAVLLGPAGFGLAGMYGSLASLTQSVAGMGVNSSGVRQIAEAAGSGNAVRIATTAIVLQRTSLVLGVLGALLLAAFAGPASQLTFGDDRHILEIRILSLAVFLQLVSFGQGALIQGMRRITDLAKMTVIGAASGTAVTLLLIRLLGEAGVVPSLVAVAGMALLTSWWYSRAIEVEHVPVSFAEAGREARALLKLGFAFMAGGLLTVGSAYLIRIILLHKVGLAATGLYQAAWTLGGLYVGIILQAMGADFYPRLTAAVHDHEECNRIVNEQTLVSLVLAGPGVVGTLTFAPLILAVLYAAEFAPAVGLLRWICLGIALRVMSWPLGYIIIAKGSQGFLIASETSWTVVHLTLAWTLIGRFGADGAGMAFCGAYAWHVVFNYILARRLTGFGWSKQNRAAVLVYTGSIGAAFLAFAVLPAGPAALLGGGALLLAVAHSLRSLSEIVSLEELPASFRAITRWHLNAKGSI